MRRVQEKSSLRLDFPFRETARKVLPVAVPKTAIDPASEAPDEEVGRAVLSSPLEWPLAGKWFV